VFYYPVRFRLHLHVYFFGVGIFRIEPARYRLACWRCIVCLFVCVVDVGPFCVFSLGLCVGMHWRAFGFALFGGCGGGLGAAGFISPKR